jgi:ADP-ribosylation factor GTPase-activating protein 2/3
MGVHVSFVRSADLDEWTQRQIDAMRLGGNGNARKFFRKHGYTDLHGHIEKKYNSKAAQSYKSELAKLVEAEAAKRGEGTLPAAESSGTSVNSLLENLELTERKELEEEARAKLAAARAAGGGGTVSQSVAKPAASMPGASRLSVPFGAAAAAGTAAAASTTTTTTTNGGPKIILRKPSSGSASVNNLLKRKPSKVGTTLRVNKLTMNALSANGGTDSAGAATATATDDAFEDVEATQKAAAEIEQEALQVAADEELARKLQLELNGSAPAAGMLSYPPPATSNGTSNSATVPVSPTKSPSVVVSPTADKGKILEKQRSAIDEGVARLKALNCDFFADT